MPDDPIVSGLDVKFGTLDFGIEPSGFDMNMEVSMIPSSAANMSMSKQSDHHHQQQQQQQVAPLVAHGYGGYKPAAPSKESSSGTTEEGSILRLLSKNNLYIQSFPNGTVSATGHDSSFYCKYLSCPHCYHRFFYQC